MSRHLHENPARNRSTVLVFAWIVLLLGTTVAARPVSAQTYVSAEPIPTPDIVGKANLARIESIGYPNLELWSRRLLNECNIVQNVIDVLWDNGAIHTLNPGNTRYGVAAGGFQAVTDPSYVFRMDDSGPGAASQADIFVLDNALGYVLNQGGNAQFSLVNNPNNPNTFPLAYAVVTFDGYLTGEQAGKFFNYLGTIDPSLWSSADAGFTQIALNNFGLSDSMLFLIGNVSTQEFTKGIFEAAATTPRTTYAPLNKNGKPTTATAGAAFPGNDWIASPGGQGYLSNLGKSSPQFLKQLAALRQKHLQAVANLLKAINNGTVEKYLDYQFSCP
jgi:hypothetical protein